MIPAEPSASPDRDAGGCFHTTHWSIVLAAVRNDSPQATEALEKLCRLYWYPLYSFIRRSGHDEESAKDLTQGFFARLLEKNDLAKVDRTRGRFRSFLLASAKHFLANEWDRQRAQRRGGDIQFISFDAHVLAELERQDLASSLTPERIFERRWATALLDTVRGRLAAEYAASGKGRVYDALQVYLSGERGEAPYAETAATLGMTVDAIKKAVERLRRRYGELVRKEIADTVARPSEIDDEIRCLRAALQG